MTDSRRAHATAPARKRPRHPAAGSRLLAAALSIGAAAGLVATMGIADARATEDTGATTVAAPLPATVSVAAARPAILLPVPASEVTAAPSTTSTTRVAATPQPIKIEPQRRVVTVKSNGSK